MNTTILKKWFLGLAAVSCAILFSANANAIEAPDALIKRISLDVMDSAKKNKAVKQGNLKQIYALVEAKIFPYVNFEHMTSLTVGRYWRQASAAQQAQLTKEFRDLLVYTYSSAIAKVDDNKVQFKPFRADPSATDVIVASRILQANGAEPIELSYRLEKLENGWKIYDVNVMGAWLVETYKNNFASEIGRTGIDGLIKALADKNKRLAAQGNVRS